MRTAAGCYAGTVPRIIEDFDDEFEFDEGTPILVKIHGSINLRECDSTVVSSCVIFEDDYLDLATRLTIGSWLSLAVEMKARRYAYLFLGYGLRDWNLRLASHRLLGNRRLAREAWAVQLAPRMPT